MQPRYHNTNPGKIMYSRLHRESCQSHEGHDLQRRVGSGCDRSPFVPEHRCRCWCSEEQAGSGWGRHGHRHTCLRGHNWFSMRWQRPFRPVFQLHHPTGHPAPSTCTGDVARGERGSRKAREGKECKRVSTELLRRLSFVLATWQKVASTA